VHSYNQICKPIILSLQHNRTRNRVAAGPARNRVVVGGERQLVQTAVAEGGLEGDDHGAAAVACGGGGGRGGRLLAPHRGRR
jgi:hypothetical protein